MVGWLNTRMFDETKDEVRSQGWTPLILDTNGNGRRDAWVEPDQPLDPAKDKALSCLPLAHVLAGLLLFTGTVKAAGGLGTFFDVRNQPEGQALFSWSAAMPFGVLLGIVVAGTFKLIVEPRQLSRFYAIKDQRGVRQGRIVSTLEGGYDLDALSGCVTAHVGSLMRG